VRAVDLAPLLEQRQDRLALLGQDGVQRATTGLAVGEPVGVPATQPPVGATLAKLQPPACQQSHPAGLERLRTIARSPHSGPDQDSHDQPRADRHRPPGWGSQPGGDDEQEDRQHRRRQEHGIPGKKVPHVAAPPRAGHDLRPSALAAPGRTDGAPLCTLFTTTSPVLTYRVHLSPGAGVGPR